MSFYSEAYYGCSESSGAWGRERSHYARGCHESGLNLFQSLEEFSSTVVPQSSSPYECLPVSVEVLPVSKFFPVMYDIWSQDTRSSSDSWDNSDRNVYNREVSPGSPTDYSHMVPESSVDIHGTLGFSRMSHERSSVQPSQSVVLRLSALLR